MLLTPTDAFVDLDVSLWFLLLKFDCLTRRWMLQAFYTGWEASTFKGEFISPSWIHALGNQCFLFTTESNWTTSLDYTQLLAFRCEKRITSAQQVHRNNLWIDTSQLIRNKRPAFSELSLLNITKIWITVHPKLTHSLTFTFNTDIILILPRKSMNIQD